MLLDIQTILEVDLLVEIIGISILLGILIFPLTIKKQKIKAPAKLTVNTDTRDSEYAVNEHGYLERINWPDAHRHE